MDIFHSACHLYLPYFMSMHEGGYNVGMDWCLFYIPKTTQNITPKRECYIQSHPCYFCSSSLCYNVHILFIPTLINLYAFLIWYTWEVTLIKSYFLPLTIYEHARSSWTSDQLLSILYQDFMCISRPIISS